MTLPLCDEMLGRLYEDQTCSVARSLEVIGERWTLLVLRDAFLGVRRFDDFQRSLGIARNVLATRLERLVEASCESSIELARLDEALAAGVATADVQARDRLLSARALLQTRLTNASGALRQLYVTGLTNESTASERVAELTSELHADANARRAALAELSQLLDAASKR